MKVFAALFAFLGVASAFAPMPTGRVNTQLSESFFDKVSTSTTVKEVLVLKTNLFVKSTSTRADPFSSSHNHVSQVFGMDLFEPVKNQNEYGQYKNKGVSCGYSALWLVCTA